MMSDRTFAGVGLAAVAAVALLATPALSAMGDGADRAASRSAIAGRFTPATGDPVLLQRFARLSAESRSSFRFTPALARSENRAVTLVVRARQATVRTSTTAATAALPIAAPTAIAITPVSQRIGAARGYTAFATAPSAPTIIRESLSGSAMPTARAPEDATRRPSRFAAGMRLDNRDRSGTPERATDRTTDTQRSYSVDVTGSYRLTRNLDVTAGVRVARENDRLQPLTDGSTDSQAVYVGTQFRF